MAHFNKKNKRLAIERRRQAVSRLYCQGMKQWDIARELQVSQTLVSRDLQVIFRRWHDEAVTDYDARIAREIAKLDLLEEEAWIAYKRSCRPKVRDLIDVGKLPAAVNSETLLALLQTEGDPKWIRQVYDCVVTRLRLLGQLREVNVNLQQPLVFQSVIERLSQRTGFPPDPADVAIEQLRQQARLPCGLKELGNGASGKHPPTDTEED
jgi:hypothetical protein